MLPATFIVVVDANVLFPLTLRDTVLRAAAAGFYQLRWSAEILDEMERNLVSKGTVPADKAARLRATMEKFFPEAQVTDYKALIPAMKNDPKDRHVVAARNLSTRMRQRWLEFSEPPRRPTTSAWVG